MRLERFEPAGLQLLGEGVEKKVFVGPKNEKGIISVRKEWMDKETPRQLKGRYYLTKIAHLLLPRNIPDIHQVREATDGKQAVDSERISHSAGQALLQRMRRSGKDEEPARKQIISEMGAEAGKLDLELERIGLGFSIDSNAGNYTKNEKGDVYYLETFESWWINSTKKDVEVLFDEEALRDAINALSDEVVKRKSTHYLDRLLVLMEEEKQELQAQAEAGLAALASQVEEIESMFSPVMNDEILATLYLTKTAEEAMNSEVRKSARKVRDDIFAKLQVLKDEIPGEEYDRLKEQFLTLSRAIGTINMGIVDHTR
ncbi:MAG: hypothetical protein WC764_04540 [Candidatus Paceibacterota bacterium]|jgi:hypothetical protein